MISRAKYYARVSKFISFNIHYCMRNYSTKIVFELHERFQQLSFSIILLMTFTLYMILIHL